MLSEKEKIRRQFERKRKRFRNRLNSSINNFRYRLRDFMSPQSIISKSIFVFVVFYILKNI